MSPDDRRLCALLAAFVPDRASELAALHGGPDACEVSAAVEALVGAGRSARLAELARALTPDDPATAAAIEGCARAAGARAAARLRQRLWLEHLAAR